MASAWDSHFAFPSFSVIDPSSRKTWVIVIFDTPESPKPALGAFEDPKGFRSTVDAIGESTLC